MKRGLTESTLIGLILALAGGIVLASVIGVLISKGGDKVDFDLCRSNVQVAATSAQLLKVTSCHTKPLGNLVVTDSKKYNEEVSQQIAKAVYECNYQFGETAGLPWKGDTFSRSTVCFVCSTFKLPEKGAALPRDSLISWMKTHNNPQKITYLEQALPRAPFNDERFLAVSKLYSIVSVFGTYLDVTGAAELSSDREYAVVSFGAPKDRGTQLYDAYKGAPSDKTISKSGTEVNSIFITDFDVINKNCDITFVRYP